MCLERTNACLHLSVIHSGGSVQGMANTSKRSKYYLTLEHHGLILNVTKVLAGRRSSLGGHVTHCSYLVNVC